MTEGVLVKDFVNGASEALGAGFPPDLLSVRVAAPTAPGDYPIIQFQHGTAQKVARYGELVRQIAAQGYVVVAPQMYVDGILGFVAAYRLSPKAEAHSAVALTDWIRKGIPDLPTQVCVDENHVVLMGHSRGAQTCWLAQTLAQAADRKIYRGIIGVDPVEGAVGSSGLRTCLFQDRTEINLQIPSLLISASDGGHLPDDYRYKVFLRYTSPTPSSCVLDGTGHTDICMDEPVGLFERIQRQVSGQGSGGECSREKAIRNVVSLTSAFIRHTSAGNVSSFLPSESLE